MKATEDKLYAVKVSIKQIKHKGVKYKGKSFKGIALAKSPTDAKEKTTQMLLNAWKGNVVPVTREDLVFKSIELYNHFRVK